MGSVFMFRKLKNLMRDAGGDGEVGILASTAKARGGIHERKAQHRQEFGISLSAVLDLDIPNVGETKVSHVS